MQRAKLCIQCTAPDGTTVGSFLFSGHDDSGQRVLASPVFPDLLPLFQWCNANDWKAETTGYLSDYVK